jgi:hypothetical protein
MATLAGIIVGDPPVAAVFAGLDMTAERRRAAMFDRRHHLEFGKTQGMLDPIGGAGSTEDVGDLERGAHRLSRRAAPDRRSQAWAHETIFMRGGMHPENYEKSLRHAHAAIEHGPGDAVALALAGFTIGMMKHDRKLADQVPTRAIAAPPPLYLATGHTLTSFPRPAFAAARGSGASRAGR